MYPGEVEFKNVGRHELKLADICCLFLDELNHPSCSDTHKDHIQQHSTARLNDLTVFDMGMTEKTVLERVSWLFMI